MYGLLYGEGFTLNLRYMDILEDDVRQKAKALYWEGHRVAYISKELNVKSATVHSWKKRDDWDSTAEVQRTEFSLSNQINRLVAKLDKTPGDLKELECLMKQMERCARIRKFDQGGNQSDLNPNLKARNKDGKKRKKKNYLSEDDVQLLKDALEAKLYGHQRVWYEAGLKHRIRDILKSRQIGATYFFALEAIVDGAETGRNQIFLSASKAQAHQFKSYILQFVEEVTGVLLTGDPIVLGHNDATLYFLGTNTKTAQSYHGNVYMDEYFWIHGFQEFRKVASAMAIHNNWRQTYFSTPSAMSHEAYPFWSGSHYNRGRKKEDHIKLDVSHNALKDGAVCADGQWRQIVTVEDAVATGFDKFTLDQIRLEYSGDEYENLLMCKFIDDTASIFSVSTLMKCMCESLVEWNDFKSLSSSTPFGDRPVWIGYDPARTRDSAAIVVIAPPSVDGGKFRVLEKIMLRDIGFDKQADDIETLTKKYNVQKIAIDTTGIGYGVHDLVKAFFPTAIKINYTPEVKTRLVLKAQSTISNGRFQFDHEHKDIVTAFMSIRKSVTPSGNAVTYEAVRTEEAGHGDVAWAIMHALDQEPLQGVTKKNRSFIEVC